MRIATIALISAISHEVINTQNFLFPGFNIYSFQNILKHSIFT